MGRKCKFIRKQVKIVDFTHPEASEYWENEIELFYKNLNFDGLWLDMNEVSNFVNGNVPQPYDDNNLPVIKK